MNYEETKVQMPGEGKHLQSNVETVDYDVFIDVHIRHKQGAEAEAKANARAVELLGGIVEQLKSK